MEQLTDNSLKKRPNLISRSRKSGGFLVVRRIHVRAVSCACNHFYLNNIISGLYLRENIRKFPRMLL